MPNLFNQLYYRFIDTCTPVLLLFLVLCLNHVAVHEYCYHIIDDIATIKERNSSNMVYGKLPAAEGSCEYIAFSNPRMIQSHAPAG